MKSLKKYFISILLLSISSYLNAQNLADYLKIAAENNPGLKAKYAEFESAMQRVTQVNTLPEPTLSIGDFIIPVETRVGPQKMRFGLTQMFPWFGTLSAKSDAATLLAEAKYQDFLNAKNELYFQVKAAWYPLIEVNKVLSIQKENRAILLSYKQLTNSCLKNGKGSMVNVIRVDIMLESVETDIKLLQDKIKPLTTIFNNLLNRADTTSVIISTELSTENVNVVRKDSALNLNPNLIAFDLKLKSMQAQEEIARKQAYPSFGVGIDYVIVGERKDMVITDNGKDVLMPMVTISLPILRNKYKAAIKETQFAQTAISASKENYHNNLVSLYEMTWYELESAQQIINLNASQISKTQQAISLLLTAYSNSGNEFEEVLRMQQELLKYQISQTMATTAYYTALAKLDYLTAESE